MCTLVAAVRQYGDFPLVVAANRDELLARASSPIRLWEGPPRFLAPRDEVALGTWLGLTAAGLFVGVTNRFGVPKDPSRRSRGELVLQALRSRTARELHARMAQVDPRSYNAFHLFYADRDEAFVTWSGGEALRQQALPPGLHVITERSLGGDDRARTELARREYPKAQDRRAPPAEALAALLRTHHPEDPLGSLCVHVPVFGYGTRSSLVLRLAPQLQGSDLLWAEGAPCQTPFTPQGDLLRALASS